MMNNKTNSCIQAIKSSISELIHEEPEQPPKTISDYLRLKTGYNYNYLSNIFSKAKGITIEQYLISQKIEYAKELLLMNDLTITIISNQLRYSSVSHFSKQFKKTTGFSPRVYKKMKQQTLFQ